ncbi:MAG: outer membrane beta-barrel protein, partial [Rhizobacter sp.]|nr:outer membrane beta-barrel protein [Ferruginibacter sp.]
NKYLHNSDEMVDSPQYGWEQMQFLLEKNMPQKKDRKFFPSYIVAASLITIFLMSSLVISNVGRVYSSVKNNIQAAAGNAQPVKPILQLTGTIIPPSRKGLAHSLKNDAAKKTANLSAVAAGKSDLVLSSWYLPALVKAEMQLLKNNKLFNISSANYLPVERSIGKVKLKDLIAEAPGTDSTGRASNNKNKNRKSTWDLSAGLAVNGMIGQKQNLRPYPAAELRYNISNTFFLTLGLTAASPVNTESKGTKKTVYVNDTSNNVYFYNSVKQYSRLTYADIPLMAGMKINKKLAVQGGVQAAVLLKTTTTTAVEPYDFRMSPTNTLLVNLVPGTTIASQHNYEVAARKIDYRFIAGLKYNVNNKASFNVTYQYSPRSILKGDNVSDNKNQLLSLGMLLKIK